MEYLLIAFLIAVVLSPLAWMKSSPGQRSATGFRNKAIAAGLRVQLVPEVDADEQAKRPEAVRYFLPFPPSSATDLAENLGAWTLIRNRRRGWESPWSGWNWFRTEAPRGCHQRIAEAVALLPEVVYGIKAEASGVSAYLRETGTESAVDEVVNGLRVLLSR